MHRVFATLFVLALTSIACTLGGSLPQPTVASQPTTIVQPTSIVVATTTSSLPTSGSVASAPTTAGSTVGNCTARTDWPIYIVASGDTLSNIAARIGSTVNDLVAANCLTNANSITVGQQLRVPTVPQMLITPTSNTCPGNISWFFTFTAIDRLCPNAATTRGAIGEDFEGGRMLWYAALPGESDQRATIYVIYNDNSWETFPDGWSAGQTSSDPSIVPPASRFQPVDSLGKVWRENASVKQHLGWAYEQQQTFTGHMQTVIEPNPRPTGYVDHWYLDHGKQGIVLRLYSVDMGPNRWEVAGSD